MKWEKQGLIYCPQGGEQEWINNTALTPTPFLLDEETIRVYCSFRDSTGKGRIGYVDVESKNPSNIMKISERPVVELGTPGCFDDNGMILGDVLNVEDRIYMYYVAFQLVEKVKFLAFSGVLISEDNGDTFYRIKQTPVMDRTEKIGRAHV